MASAGLGVKRGRLPGATADAWPASAKDCEPRDDGHKPVPGITGPSKETSLVVAENTLPWPSMAQA